MFRLDREDIFGKGETSNARGGLTSGRRDFVNCLTSLYPPVGQLDPQESEASS